MKSSHIFFGIFASIILSMASSAHAATSSDAVREACRDRAVAELGIVRDDFRGHLFGARTDKNGKVTVLTGGFSKDKHVGIFETKGRLTSELVSPIVESYRVLRCRSIAFCSAIQVSVDAPDDDIVLRSLGCEPVPMKRFDECRVPELSPAALVTLQGECGTLVDQSLKAERAILQLAVSYDAGYRATLQLGGMIEWMQENLPSAAVKPLRAMVNMLGKLHEIPCFISQCDAPDTSGLAS